MRTLVTGATGFLGTALTRELRRRRTKTVAVGSQECDLRVAGSLDRLAGKFDVIFHLAAWTQAGTFCLQHPGEQWIINQQINTNVLSWWVARQPQAKLVSIGTSCAYDPAMRHIEPNYVRGEPIEDLRSYGMTKRMLHIGQEAIHRQYGHSFLTLVPATLYGPGYKHDGRQSHFIVDVIRKILLARATGRRPVLWGDGYQVRELIYIDDFVGALLALTATQSQGIINVGAGRGHSIRNFAREVCAVVGYDPERIRYDERQYVGARRKQLVVEKFRTLLPEWKPTPLRDGLRRTVEWLQTASLTGPPVPR